jgi:4-amino-4-deoxy-L-arabinose transferase-like glycosyltransferase
MKSDASIRDLLLLTLFLGLFFGFELGDRALWSPEEGHYSEIAREMVVSGDYVTPRLAGMTFLEKPPLFIWLQCAAIRLFGVNEWSLRLWPAVFAVAGCLAVYVVGRELFGRRTGLISSAVLATSGLYYALGHVINLDMAVSVLISCALLAFLLGTKEPPGYRRRFAMWGFFVFSALAVLTKGLIGIVIPGLVIGTWILLLGEWNILTTMYLPSGILLFLLVAAPWHVLVSRVNPEFLQYYFIHQHFQRYLTKPEGPFQQPWAFIPVFLLGLFPWALFLVQAVRRNLCFSWRQRLQHKEVIFLALWAGWVFLFFSASRFKVIPYILPMFPPLAILIARYFAAVWDTRPRSTVRSAYWILAATILILVVASRTTPQHYLERYSSWPNEVSSDEGTIAAAGLKEDGDLRALTTYIYAQTGILLVGAITTLLLLGKSRGFRWGFLSLTLTWALFLVVLNSSLPLLDQRRSVKGLANVLRSRLQPADEVATYQAYYQDLPVYLQRRINIVDWKGDLQFEVQVDKNGSSWVIDEATFWERWNSPVTLYMLTDQETYEKLRQSSKQRLYLVSDTNYDVLLSNKATPHISWRSTSGRFA